MDPCRFDTLVRTLTTSPSRRRLLGALSALPLVGTALVGTDEDSSATTGKSRTKRRRKRQDRERQRIAPVATSCAKQCRKKTTKRARRRCRKQCGTPSECTTNQDCPTGELCEDGRCIPSPDQCATNADCDACERCDGGVCLAQCQPDEVCRANQCEAVQCTSDRECGDCSRCVESRCRWQCSPTEVCLSGAGGRCCQPRSCPAGLDCGTVDDGCSGQARCGTCAAPETCGGGGIPNQCGCTPITTCPDGADCGTIPDGCGSTVRCGPDSCTQPANPCQQTTCQSNVCTTGPGNNGATCNDGNVCTTGSTCSGGTCGGGTSICTQPAVCQTTVGATCDPGSGTCTYPTAANGTTCGTQSVPGGGTTRCCNATCPDPTCVPAGQRCPVQSVAGCIAGCCTGGGNLFSGTFFCAQSGFTADIPCGSDTDCSFGLCQCGVCCVASGAAVNGLGCAGCCSKACNGSVCA